MIKPRCRLCFRLLVFVVLAQIGVAWSAIEANQAPPQDLVAIKGIGPATSQRIIEARREQPFNDWDDFIRRVRGIGPATAARLSAHGLTVNGQRFQPTAQGTQELLWQPMVPRPVEPPR